MKKRTVKQHSMISEAIALVAVVILLLGWLLGESVNPYIFYWLAIAAMVISIIYRAIYVRCPHCGDRWVGVRITPDFCPKCGRYID